MDKDELEKACREIQTYWHNYADWCDEQRKAGNEPEPIEEMVLRDSEVEFAQIFGIEEEEEYD